MSNNNQEIINNIEINKDDSYLYSIEELLQYTQLNNLYTFYTSIKKETYNTKLYLSIKKFTFEINYFEGFFEKTYEIPFTSGYINKILQYKISKECIDNTIDKFEKDLDEYKQNSRTFKNKIKHDARIKVWLALVAITAILTLIIPLYELPLKEKLYVFLSWLFPYSFLSLCLAYTWNDSGNNRFPIWFFIVHIVMFIPCLAKIIYNIYF